MIWNDLTRKAFELANNAHAGQVDKGGAPYILHPLRVAQNMPTPELVAVALLHDVIEDTFMTADSLYYAGIPMEVVEAVVFLTHDRNVPYLEYVKTVSKHKMASIVKKADLRHNSDQTRETDEPTQTRTERLAKYEQALSLLSDVEDYY